MRLRGFTAVGMAMLFLLSGLPLTAQSPSSSSAPPPVSIWFSVPSELERLRGELERELSQRFREAGEGLGVPLPRNNPVPGMSIGIFPDGTFAAVVPARGLASLPSVLRGRTTLGLLYLSAPGGQLPSGFYRMELSYGPRSQVILTGVAVGGTVPHLRLPGFPRGQLWGRRRPIKYPVAVEARTERRRSLCLRNRGQDLGGRLHPLVSTPVQRQKGEVPASPFLSKAWQRVAGRGLEA